MMNKHCWYSGVAVLAVLILAAAISSSTAADVSPLDPVCDVSQTQYQIAQLALQDMGLGLYGGADYNQGFRNRYNTGGSARSSKGFQEANLYLRDRFASLGLAVNQQSDYQNVIAELPGIETPDRLFIIGGHYDHRQDNAEAPGGDDNASGSAGVLEAARVLSRYQFKSTIRFIAWGGEEGWMLGSWDYARNVIKPNSDPAHQDLAGMLNMDMIIRPGWDSNPTHVQDLDLSTRVDEPQCLAWANAFKAAAAVYAQSLLVNPTIHGEDWYPSDQGPFMSEDQGFLYPALMIAENTASEIWNQGANAYYHTADDASDRLANDPHNSSGIVYDYGFATDVVRAAVGMLAEQAELVACRPAVWSGSADNDVRWSVASNWGGVALFAGAPLVFGPLSGGHVANRNDLPSSTRFRGVTFAAGAQGYDLAGNSIQLADPVINQSAGNQTISLGLEFAVGGGTFDNGDGSITVYGPISGAGPLVKTGGGTLALGGPNIYTDGTLVSSGTLLVTSVLALPSGGSLTIGASGTVVLASGSSMAGAATVPEPSTLALLGIGAIGALAWVSSRITYSVSPGFHPNCSNVSRAV